MLDLAENPGVADGCASDHDTVYAVPTAVSQGFLGRVDVAVAENRNVNVGMVFHLGNGVPVGFALVHLLCRVRPWMVSA